MAILMALPSLPVQAQVRLPALGESASPISASVPNAAWATRSCAKVRRDPAYLDDPVLLEYLQSLWRRWWRGRASIGNIDSRDRSRLHLGGFLVRDRSVNAFALPGGYVGVHLGLIALTTTSDKLASVLAHELTHVTQRHIARSIAPQQNASMVAHGGHAAGHPGGQPRQQAPTWPTPRSWAGRLRPSRAS
jgi:predicted Zn-dependent protease